MGVDIAVLVNPTAGRGKGARIVEPVTQRLRDAGIKARWEAGRDGLETMDLARRWVARGVDGLVVVGGDGMVHLALQAVAGSKTALGIVPAGTGNDLARAAGIPRSDPLAAADIVVAGHVAKFDLGKVGAHWFSTVLCAGFDSRVSERVGSMRWVRGRTRYDLATVAELRVFRPLSYVLEIDGERIETDAMLVAVGNTASYGGGLRICEGADPADGKLDVATIDPLRRRDLVRLFPKLSQGTHLDHPAVTMRRGKQVSLASAELTAYADGERIGPLPVTAECVPAALRLYTPPPR